MGGGREGREREEEPFLLLGGKEDQRKDSGKRRRRPKNGGRRRGETFGWQKGEWRRHAGREGFGEGGAQLPITARSDTAATGFVVVSRKASKGGGGKSTISFYLLLRKVYSFLGRGRGEVAPAGDCRTKEGSSPNHPLASLLQIKKVRGTRNFRWLEMPTAGNGNPHILEEEEKEESVHFSVFMMFFFRCFFVVTQLTQKPSQKV